MPKSPKSPRKYTNYLLFCKLYKPILEKEYPKISPQERLRKCGQTWNSLSNEQKNQFTIYANDERRLSDPSLTKLPHISDFAVIFDDRVSNNSSEEGSSAGDNSSPNFTLADFQKYFNI
jgi:hypothetical protein